MEEEQLELPSDTLKILNDFLQEKAQRERQELETIQNINGKEAKFEEDWQLSQFWYNESTKRTLRRVVEQLTANQSANSYSIALLSCPSLYATVKEVHDNVMIFEFDKRFAAYGDDFVFYDFNEADAPGYLQQLYANFDLIIADPPFLSEECITKISKIILNLEKPGAKVIFCSGEVVAPWLMQCLHLQMCKFRPEHERNLGNEFVSYANFNLDDFIES